MTKITFKEKYKDIIEDIKAGEELFYIKMHCHYRMHKKIWHKEKIIDRLYKLYRPYRKETIEEYKWNKTNKKMKFYTNIKLLKMFKEGKLGLKNKGQNIIL